MKNIALGCLLAVVAVSPAHAASELKFGESGKPASLVLGGVEFLKTGSPGFVLRTTEGKDVIETPLNDISVSGDTVKVSHPDGTPSFTFQIAPYDKHLAIHLLKMEGVGREHELSLLLDTEDVAAYTLNDLMTENTGNRRRKSIELSWPYLWGRQRPNGTHGSVVLYNGKLDGSERDAVLAEIWSKQSQAGHMVRPAGKATWTEAEVLAWVDQWVKKFSSIAKVSVDAENMEELREMTDKYVIPSKANRVYMFSNVWRAKGQGMVAVNTNLFPKGKEDFLAYRDYLASHGIHLQLKSLSPQIDEDYEKYISPDHVDPRIMRWATGSLVEDVDTDATTLKFRISSEQLGMKSEGFMRVGNEIVEAKKISPASEGVWILEGCKRGYGASTPKAHKAGTEMAGCVEINGSFNFEDDFGQPNSLAEEICAEYGDFLNEMNVGHIHFDGTGRMGQYPWFVRDFTDYVYSRVDQPVTGSRVGGELPANFEHQFSAAKAIIGATGYRDIRVGPRLHQKGRKHTEHAVSLLDLHFDAADGIMTGSRRPALLGGQSGAALEAETLRNYGLTPVALELFRYWVELAPVFDDADLEYVAGFMKKGGHHYQGEDVLVLGKNDKGEFIYTPHRVMGQTSGKDEPFQIDQEWGAEPRFQEISTGTTMELLNPYEAQEPQVVIHVKEGSAPLNDPVIRVDAGGLSVKGEIRPNEYMKFEGGEQVQVYDKNWNKLRTLPAVADEFTVKMGENTLTVASGSDSDATELRLQFITLGPVHVLASNKHLKSHKSK